MSKKVFFVAAVEGQEPFQFWSGAITVEEKSDIDSLQNALVKKYAQSHNAFAATVYQLHKPRSIGTNDARLELANFQTLLLKANELYPAKIIQDVLSARQTLVAILHCTALLPTAGEMVGQLPKESYHSESGKPPAKKRKIDLAEPDTALKAFYEKAWGKQWPQHQATISKQEIGISKVEYDENYAYPPPDSDIPNNHTYTCLENMNEVATALKLGRRFEDVVVVLDEYNWLREYLDTIAPSLSAVIVGQPGTGKTMFLLYLLLYRLERQCSTAIQFHPEYLFVFDEQGVQVYSSSEHTAAEPRIHKCWALSDSNSSLGRPCDMFLDQAQCVIQVSSPPVYRWKSWTKQKISQRIISKLPRVLEIGAVLKELKCDPAQTLALVSQWGPSLRVIKDIVKDEMATFKYTPDVQAAAKELWNDPSSYTTMWSPPNGDGSLVLFFRPRREYVTFPGPPIPILDTATHNFIIPTKFLTDRFMDYGIIGNHRVSYDLLAILSSHYETRCSAGRAHEMMMHHRMCNGGTPLVLYSNNGLQMNMQPSTVLIPGTVRSLKESASFYWMPSAGNFTGVDGALSDGNDIFILQASIADEHSSPLDGIKKVWQNVSSDARKSWEWHFVAVADTQRLANSLLEEFTAQLANFTLGREKVNVKVWACVLGRNLV